MNTPAEVIEELDMTCLAAGTVAGEVRQRIALRIANWGLRHLASDLQLIAAELVTNACAAVPYGRIRVGFTREQDAVLLGIWDASDRMPRMQPVRELNLEDLDLSEENFDQNGGWGLRLVESISSECGVTKTDPHGKWVWSRLRL